MRPPIRDIRLRIGGLSNSRRCIKIVKVFSKPACVQCNATYRKLKERGIEYEVIDVSQDTEALNRIKELGYLQAPVVMTDDDHWSGFRPDKIDAL